MPKGEGTRDAICPLLKFKKTPPKAVFFDWGCKANESSLNWAGAYFRDTAFYHDVFHGVAHKCPNCYDSRRISNYAGLNTSLMEQVNSFLQPLRGILKSGTTRVNPPPPTPSSPSAKYKLITWLVFHYSCPPWCYGCTSSHKFGTGESAEQDNTDNYLQALVCHAGHLPSSTCHDLTFLISINSTPTQ